MEQPNIDYDAIIDRALDREVGGYPTTAGHLEIQAVKHAVREISNAILAVKGIINDVPLSQLSVHQQGAMEKKLEFVSGLIQRFPDRLTTLIVARKQEVDGLTGDRRMVAEVMSSLQERLAAVDSKKKQLAADEYEVILKKEQLAADAKAVVLREKQLTVDAKAVVLREKQLAVDAEAVDLKKKRLAVNTKALDSKEKQLVVEAEAFQANRNRATEKMKEAVKMLRAAEKKERRLASRERSIVGLEETRVLEMFLNPGTDGAADDEAEADPAIASEDESSTSSSEILSADAGVNVGVDRERRVEESEEEKAVDDLNLGADVTIEDAAEATAAEKRVIERLNRLSKKPTPAAANGETSPTDLERQRSSDTHSSSSERDLLGPGTIAAQEERLWQREAHLASREYYVRNREAAVLKREQLLERLKDAHMQLAQNWMAQVKEMTEDAAFQAGVLNGRYRDLIALRDEVRRMQDRVWKLIAEARGVITRAGGEVALLEEVRERVSGLIAEARGLVGVRDEVREMQGRVSDLLGEARGLIGSREEMQGGLSDLIEEARRLIRMRDEVLEMQDRIASLVGQARRLIAFRNAMQGRFPDQIGEPRGLVGADGGDGGDSGGEVESEDGDKDEAEDGSQDVFRIGHLD